LYKNPKASVESRVKDLLKRMTLEEKIGQMRHIHSENYDVNGKVDMQKLQEFTNGLSFGCVEAFPYTSVQFANAIVTIQKHMVENTRLGIPIIPIMEGLHGTVQDGCTIYPQAIALGSTFNPSLVYQMTQHIAGEMKAMNVKQVLAPDLDLARELRWGRVEETYGEDPFLVGQMGVAYVKGMRENNIICTPKHFVGHGSPLGGINLASVEGGDRELFSLYLPPFEKVLKEGDPLSIMNCYTAYDDVPVTGSEYFMTDILRGKLGFKGYVYSDWGSVSMLAYFHKTAIDGSDAARQAVQAGVDLEAGGDDYKNLENLIKSGMLDIKYVDQAG
jgi:beta-glucosidase